MKSAKANILKSLIAVLAVGFILPLSVADAQSGKRLSGTEVRTLVESSRQKMLQERTHEEKLKILKVLLKHLSVEFDKGAAVFDETFVEVNAFQMNIEFLVNNDCTKSYELVANQTQGAGQGAPSVKERKAREYRIQLHAALCKKN